ncbi:MAG: hypothetical protein RL095_3303 [Verrucomicrobiota bacterium]|jgi:predicted permease
MSPILTILLPLILLTALARWGISRHWFSAAFLRDCSKFCYWVALPAFLFDAASKTRLQSSDLLPSGILLSATLAVCFLAWLGAKAAGMAAESRASLVHAGFRGNLAYVGIPVVAFAGQSLQLEGLNESCAVLAAAPVIPCFSILAVAVLTLNLGQKGSGRIQNAAWETLKNPLILSTLAGLALAYFSLPLPAVLQRCVAIPAAAALPLALILLAEAVDTEAFRSRWKPALAAAILKTLVKPLIVFVLCQVFALDKGLSATLLLLAACPTAIASQILNDRLGGDSRLQGAAIALSTLMAPLAMSLILIWAAP